MQKCFSEIAPIDSTLSVANIFIKFAFRKKINVLGSFDYMSN